MGLLVQHDRRGVKWEIIYLYQLDKIIKVFNIICNINKMLTNNIYRVVYVYWTIY